MSQKAHTIATSTVPLMSVSKSLATRACSAHQKSPCVTGDEEAYIGNMQWLGGVHSLNRSEYEENMDNSYPIIHNLQRYHYRLLYLDEKKKWKMCTETFPLS